MLNVLASISYLETKGIKAVAVTGHLFGGAVVIQMAASSYQVIGDLIVKQWN